MDPRESIAASLDWVDAFEPRLNAISIENAEPGSAYEADQAAGGEYGNIPLLTAMAKLAVAMDHLQALASLIDADGVRRFASMTLIRPSFEAGPMAQWLLDVSLSPRERLGRAFGDSISNLKWSNKVEADMIAAGWPFAPDYRRGDNRADELQDHATREGVTISVRNPVDLLMLYPASSDSHDDVVAYRFVSGILHGQEWATSVGDYAEEPTPVPRRIETTVNPEIASAWIAWSMTHFDAGLAAAERYAASLESEAPGT